MIKAGKFSLDLEADVMDPGILDTAPFPLLFKTATCHVPDFTDAQAVPVSDKPAITPAIIDKCSEAVFSYDLETEDEKDKKDGQEITDDESDKKAGETDKQITAKPKEVKWDPFLSERKS